MPLLFGRRVLPAGHANQALGRSRGGLSTKLHMLYYTHGISLAYQLSPGQWSDVSQAVSLLESVRLPSSRPERPRTRCLWLLCDKGYNSDSLRHHRSDHRIRAVIPYRRMHRRSQKAFLISSITPCTASAMRYSVYWDG